MYEFESVQKASEEIDVIMSGRGFKIVCILKEQDQTKPSEHN